MDHGYPAYTANAHDEWVDCPQCKYSMLPLRDYEVQAVSEFPAIEGDWIVFLLFGWVIFLAQVIFMYAIGLITYATRKSSLARAKATVLPQFPNSLTCPKCQHVTRRK